MGMTTIALPVRREPSPMGRMLRQTAVDSGYLLIGFTLAVASFVVMVTGLSMGVGMFFLLGLPLLIATLYAARGFAELERVRIGPVLGRRVARPTYYQAPPEASLMRRLLAPAATGQYWLDLLHGLVVFAVSTATFTVAVTWWSSAVAGSLYLFYGWFVGHPNASIVVIHGQPLTAVLGMGDSVGARVALYTSIGLFFLGTLPLVMRGLALTQAHLGRVMLCGVAEMRLRISGL